MAQVNPTLPTLGGPRGDNEAVERNFLLALLNEFNGNVDSSNLKIGAVAADRLSTIVQNALVPAGSMLLHAGATAPGGYLLCDGSEVGATFTALIAALNGNPHGVGPNGRPLVPDMRGRVPAGVGTATGAAGATAKTLGQKGGEQAHTLTGAETPSLGISGWDEDFPPASDGRLFPRVGRHAPNWTTTAVTTGGGSAHNIEQPFVGLNYIIRTGA